MIKNLDDKIYKESVKVFPCNFKNFNLTVRSYKREIKDRPFESDDLESELFKAIKLYQERDCSKTPPHLCRYANEDREAFLDRLYEAHGAKYIKRYEVCA